MAYTPTVWETGDVITAVKLNKAENGIAAASVAELPSVSDADEGKVLTVDSSGDWVAAASAFVIPVSYDDATDTMTLGASWNEIYANKNRLVLAVYEYESSGGTPVLMPLYLIQLSEYQGTYSATFLWFNGENTPKLGSVTFTASSADADMTFVD